MRPMTDPLLRRERDKASHPASLWGRQLVGSCDVAGRLPRYDVAEHLDATGDGPSKLVAENNSQHTSRLGLAELRALTLVTSALVCIGVRVVDA
jgi:hypothetical protein